MTDSSTQTIVSAPRVSFAEGATEDAPYVYAEGSFTFRDADGAKRDCPMFAGGKYDAKPTDYTFDWGGHERGDDADLPNDDAAHEAFHAARKELAAMLAAEVAELAAE